MTKLQLLHRALNERLMAAVDQIMEMVGGTVLEYEKETIRARKENEVLRRKLRWMEGSNPAGCPGPSEPIVISNPDESTPSQQDEGVVNFEFGQESGALVIKTESSEYPLCVRPESSITTLPQTVDQGSDNAGTSAGIAYGLSDSMTWDSAQSYMAPLDFDPTSGPNRVRSWGGYSKRQRMSFACPDCGKVFGTKQRLMIHMRIHSTERPYTYRQRKACFYGDNKKKRKLHEISQVSNEAVDDLSDASEQTNRSSASPGQLKVTDEVGEPDGLSTESDHTSSNKESKNTTTIRVRRRRGRKRRASPQSVCYCPYCPQQVFAQPCQLAIHMKTHSVKTLVNLRDQAQSRDDVIVDAKRKLPKRQRKNNAVKKAKVAGKTEFPCPECERVFPYANRLLFHMKTHKSKRALLRKEIDVAVHTKLAKEETVEAVPKTTEVQIKKTFSCPHCDKVFAREGWLVPHIQSQHREVKLRSGHFNAMLCSGQTKSKRLSQQLCKLKTETKGVSEELKRETEESEMVTFEKEGFTASLKPEPAESKKVKPKPSPSSEKSNLVICLSRITADEAHQSADHRKSGTDKAKSALEQSNEESLGSHGGQSNTRVMKRMFPCKVCGKEFVREKKLKKHLMKHTEHELNNEKTKKRKQTLMERRRKVDEKDRLCKMSTSIHNSNTTQTPQGPPNKELLRKSRGRGQGPLPCPFCGKVFAWEMRLLIHMQIHCGDKPYPYRQRKKRFYGDLKRGQLPKIQNQEPLGNNSEESGQSAGEETVNGAKSTHLRCGATHAVSGALSNNTETTASEEYSGSLCPLPQIATTPCNKNNQTTKAALISDVMRHFSLQPRIVLEPIKPECNYWSSGCAQRSGFDHEQTSCSVLLDHEMEDAMEDKIVLSDGKENFDEDMLSSHVLTTSLPNFQNEDLDVDGKNSSSESNFPAPDTTDSIKTDDSTCVNAKSVVESVPSEREDQRISNDPLARDQMDSPVSSEKIICQTSDIVFADQSSLSEGNAVSGSETKNKMLDVNNQGPESQTSSTDDNSTSFKTNHCLYCKQPHYSMVAHLQSVHSNEPEVAKALTFDKSSQERKNLLKLLQTKGNFMHNTNLVPHSRTVEECKGISVDSNDGQAGGANLQFQHSPENEGCFELESVNSPEPSTGQESIDFKNEKLGLQMSDVDQEETKASTSNTSFLRAYPKYDVVRNSCDGFSPLNNDHIMSGTSKNSMKARTYGRGRKKKKKKRRSHVQNQSLIKGDEVLGEGEMPNSKIHVCQDCRATFCSPYTLRRHQYTHTGERPFWCHECNMGFIQKYRLLQHMFAYHGDATSSLDQEKLTRARRRIQTSVDEAIQETLAISPEDLPEAVQNDTWENVAATNQDTEERELHWEEAEHSKDFDTN